MCRTSLTAEGNLLCKMKKVIKFKDFEDPVDNYELFPSVGRSLSPHTYTPRSHENLLRSYSQMKSRESGSKNNKHENKKLRKELKRVSEQVRRNQAEIQRLRSKLSNVRGLDIANSNDGDDDRRGANTAESVVSILRTRDTLSSHFGEMMRRYNSAMADKNRQIEALQEKLAQYENYPQQEEQQIWSQDYRAHTSVEAERVRRKNAAIRVFQRDVALVKTQLEQSPLDEERMPCSSSRERAVVAELRRRQRFGVVADLQATGNKFLQRLEFEEKLDKLHWELESRRHLEHEGSSGGECAPTCTHRQEFEMLATTRNHLLRGLRDLRAAATAHDDQQPQPQLRDPISINTVQTLYSASANSVKSYGSVRGTTSELPDK